VSLRSGQLDIGSDDFDDISHHRQSILRFRELEFGFE
jgi:hypothetical protein